MRSTTSSTVAVQESPPERVTRMRRPTSSAGREEVSPVNRAPRFDRERLGLESRNRLHGCGGERLQAEQGAVAVADQVCGEIAFEPLLEMGVVVGIDAEGGADEDLAAGVIAAGLAAQL